MNKQTPIKKTTKKITNHPSKKSPLAPIITIIVIAAVVLGVICLAKLTTTPAETEEVAATLDHRNFAAEYPGVPEDNPFVYRTGDQIINILEKGTGIVYLGFPSCPWCQAYVTYLAQVAKDQNVQKIYYYNIYEDRKNNTETYQKILALLAPTLQYDEEGNPRIYVPNVTFVEEGKILANDFETSKDTANLTDPAAYWTEDRIAALKTRLTTYIKELPAETCTTTCQE